LHSAKVLNLLYAIETAGDVMMKISRWLKDLAIFSLIVPLPLNTFAAFYGSVESFLGPAVCCSFLGTFDAHVIHLVGFLSLISTDFHMFNDDLFSKNHLYKEASRPQLSPIPQMQNTQRLESELHL
jgi:hypothetical protein